MAKTYPVFEEPEYEVVHYLNCNFCGKRLGRFVHEEKAYEIATACDDCSNKWKKKYENDNIKKEEGDSAHD